MTETQKGWAALLAAQTLWGLAPLYYKVLGPVPALEVLAHRTVWTLILFGGWIALQGRLDDLWRLITGPQALKVIGASVMVSINWGLFIYSVQSGHTLQAAFGYYIFPLVATLAGVVFFRERLRGFQFPAIVLAGVAVLVLGFGLGALPWISLALAVTFSLYGVIKKALNVGPNLSVTAEVLFVVPLSAIYLFGAHVYGWGSSQTMAAGVFGQSLKQSLLLMAGGLVTGVPLILFTAAARRLPLTIVGMGHYWNSTIQFGLAVLVFSEPFTQWHAIAMPMIWLALALYTIEALRQERQVRRARRAATSSGTVSTVSK
nr:EamA family transporter RarD [uncultured Celeribacter sp.]